MRKAPLPPPPARPGLLFAGAALLESLFVPFLLDAMLLGLVARGAPLWRLIACAIPASLLGTMCWYGAGVLWGEDVLAFVHTAFDIPTTVYDSAAQGWQESAPILLVLTSTTSIPDPLVSAYAATQPTPFLVVFVGLLLGHALRFLAMGLIIALARLLVRRSPTRLRVWISRLSLGASLLVGLVLGGLVLARVVA